MSHLVSCRYNPNHKVKKSKLIIHEYKCPNRFNPNIIVCPFDPNEKIHINDYNKHIKEHQKKDFNLNIDKVNFDVRIINREDNEKILNDIRFKELKNFNYDNIKDLKINSKNDKKKINYEIDNNKRKNNDMKDKNKINEYDIISSEIKSITFQQTNNFFEDEYFYSDFLYEDFDYDPNKEDLMFCFGLKNNKIYKYY